MMKMIRCESDRAYETLWQQYNKLLMTEPFLPSKYKVKVKSEYSMTPELTILINQKEEEVEEALAENDTSTCDDKTPLISNEQRKSYNAVV